MVLKSKKKLKKKRLIYKKRKSRIDSKLNFRESTSFLLLIFVILGFYFFIHIYQTEKNKSVKISESNKNANILEGEYTEGGSSAVGSRNDNVIFHGPRDKKRIAITFDAEMTDSMKANLIAGKVKSSYDKRIVDILIATNTKATFFLTGMWIELYPDVTRELSQNKLFELGSHSYTDSSYAGFCYGLTQLANTLKIEEIGVTEKLLREKGLIDNKLFRFPGGCYTSDDVKLVNQSSDIVVHWDVVGADGFNANTQRIIHNVVDNSQNGTIIVLHMNGAPTAPKTADALPEIIRQLKAKGFEFVKVNELLGLPPESKG